MAQNKFLTYKGKPIVRKGNEIYYGNITDSHVILLKIKDNKTVGDMEIAENVTVQLISTAESVNSAKRVVKEEERIGLYNAMDLGMEWLEKAIRGK